MRGQEPAPRRRWWRASTPYIFCHRRLGDLETQFAQFAMNAWGAPQRIGSAHLADEIADVGRDRRSTNAPTSRAPLPVECERSAMPVHDGGRLHDPDGSAPTRPDPEQRHPQESVGPSEAGPLGRGLLKDGELMTQGENLGFKFGRRTDTGANGGEERNQNGGHVRTQYQSGEPGPNATPRTEFPTGTAYYMAIRRIMYSGLYAAPDRAPLPRLRRSPRCTALSCVRLRSIRVPHALGART